MSNSSEGDSIKIFVRVRPPDPSISGSDLSTKVLDVNTPDKAIILKTRPEPKIFTYDNVGDADISQERVFSIVGKNIIDSCIAGYNGTIFAYGQTGSGKTFTMLGPSENADSFHHENRGVIPRSIECLYSLIAQQQKQFSDQKQFLCKCSFLEIYQERIFDLLDPASQGLNMRENLNKGVFVDGLIEQVACSPSEAYKVLTTGWLNRRVAGTSMNRESSRSHAVFTISVESKEIAHGVQTIRGSCLNLVDLAGSERQKDTHTAGTHLKEAGSINRSLHVLGTVIMSLVELSNGKKRHIPYRDSKLTFLLKDSLGGNAKTHMVACVHPDSRCFGESLSTLNFARNAKLIKNKAIVNEDLRGSHLELQKEICRLKELLEAAPNSQHVGNQSVMDSVSSADLNADSVWKKCFVQAMYFRETSESEKKNLQDVIKNLQDLCEKKEKYNQSTKMIIKFRENTIQYLQKQMQSRSDDEESDDVKSLKEEIKILRQQTVNNPQLAKFSGENKNLRNQLEQMKASSSISEVLSDENRINELEKLFKELTLLKGTKDAFSVVKESPSKDKRLAEAEEKHLLEIKACNREIDTLKQSLLDAEKKMESDKMEMDIELVSCRKMISDLERALETHQQKAREENNALKDLHCQTLKVMASPAVSSRKNSLCPSRNDSVCSNRKDSIGFSNQSALALEDDLGGITDSIEPQNLVDGAAHEALLEELETLTAENSKLQQNIDENESDLLKLKQEVDKKELQFNQLKLVLEKERNELFEHIATEQALREDLEVLKQDLKWQREENADLQIVLSSADKQLKEEKMSLKKLLQNADLEKQRLETQAKKSAEDVVSLQRTLDDLEKDSKLNLESRDKELRDLKAQVAEKDGHITRNEDIISNLTQGMQEMECKVNESQASIASLKAEEVSLSQELEVLKRESATKSEEISSLQTELKDDREKFNLDLQRKDFEVTKSAEELTALHRTLKDMSEDAKSKLESKDKELCELKAQLAEKDGFIVENKDIISNLTNDIQEVERKLRESQNSFTSLNTEKMNLSQEFEELRREHTAKSAEILSLQTELEKSREQFNLDLQKKNLEAMKFAEDITSLQRTLENVTGDAKSKLESKDKELCELRAQLAEKDRLIMENKDVVSKVTSGMQEMECKLNESQASFAALKVEKTNLSQELEEMRSRNSEKSSEILALQTELEESREKFNLDLQKKDFDATKFAEDITSLQRTLEDVTGDAKSKLESKDKELCELRAQLAEKDRLIMENKDVVSKVTSGMQEMECKLNESQASFAALKVEKTNLSQELEEMRSQNSEKSSEILALQTELEESREKFNLDLQKKDFEAMMSAEDVSSLQRSLEEVTEDAKSKLESKDEELCALKACLAEKERSITEIKESIQENKRLKEQLEDSQSQVNQANEDMDSLKLELKVMAEERDRVMEQLNKEQGAAAKLIGHTNHMQKIKLMEKKHQEYRELKDRYMELERQHNKCLWRTKSNPHDSSLHKLEDITNTSEEN